MSTNMHELETEKIRAEIGKLMAETSKINAESRWYPLVMVGGIIAALGTVIKLFY